MKLLFVLVSLFILQSTLCDDGSVANDSQTCDSILGADTCTKLRDLAKLLHEKATTVSDAIKDAIAHHKKKAADVLAYVKGYIAERFQCDQVLTADLCAKIFSLGNRIKLTASQVRLAIENAVAAGKTKIQNIYQFAVEFMTTQITCAKIFSNISCNNMKLAIQKFHEQVKLLNEAIITAAQKHYNTTKDLLIAVKNTIIEKAVNFKCEDVLPGKTCTLIRDLATKLHLNVKLVREAIKEAIVNGVTKVKDIYKKVIEFLTTKINCEGLLGATACKNLVEAATKLGEQTILIQEAIMAAFLKHATNVKDIIVSVKNTLVERATNFTCTDVLTQNQCTFLKKLAVQFKLRAGELRRVLVGAIVNGTNSVVQLYKVTIGQFIEDAKNVKCEDLISPKACAALEAFAKNFHLKVQEVTTAVKVAIASGKETVRAILVAAKEFLVEKISCDKFLGETICNVLESLANKLHVSFKKVIAKLRELVASGINSVRQLRIKIVSYIWSLFFGNVNKRSLDMSSLTDTIMKMVENLIAIGKDMKDKLRVAIKNAIEQGKITIFNIKQFVKDLVTKYGPQSDDVASVQKSLIDQLKELLKNAHGKAKKAIKELLEKSREQLQKLKDYIKSILGSSDESDDALDLTHDMFADMALQQLDEEVKMAEDEAENMVYEQLY